MRVVHFELKPECFDNATLSNEEGHGFEGKVAMAFREHARMHGVGIVHKFMPRILLREDPQQFPEEERDKRFRQVAEKCKHFMEFESESHCRAYITGKEASLLLLTP